MLIYSPEQFSYLINLAYAYSQDGNKEMQKQVEKDIDEMIANRIASAI